MYMLGVQPYSGNHSTQQLEANTYCKDCKGFGRARKDLGLFLGTGFGVHKVHKPNFIFKERSCWWHKGTSQSPRRKSSTRQPSTLNPRHLS